MPFLLLDTLVARSMSSPSMTSLTEESCSNSLNLGDASQGGSLENPEGQLFTHKGKCEHEFTKDSTDRSSCMANTADKYDKTYKCSILDCKRNQGFTSLANLRRHEKEIHRMHSTGQKLHCPILTCKRHNGKGFHRNEQLKNHIRLKHPYDSDNLGRRLKRKADVDWDESFQDIKRLREDTRGLSNQFAAQAVQLANMVLLIQKLEENTGTPRRDSEQMPSVVDGDGLGEHDRTERLGGCGLPAT
jgi:hypothetical protein